ncbi:MAG: ABC transporter permease [Evtepia sp.]
MKKFCAHLSFLLLPIVLFCLWEYGAEVALIDVRFFSRPSLIWQEWIKSLQSGLLIRHLSVTLKEAFWGLLFGSVFGTATGLFLAVNRRIGNLLLPFFAGLNGLPKLALAPLLIIWFGIGISSKAIIAGTMVYFVFTFHLYTAYQNVDVELLNSVKLLGANRRQLIRLVIWPSCLPWFLTGLRTGVGMAFSGAIVGEYIGASCGLGWLINDAGGRYDMTCVLYCVLTLIVLIMIFDFGIRLLEQSLLRWRRPRTSL